MRYWRACARHSLVPLAADGPDEWSGSRIEYRSIKLALAIETLARRRYPVTPALTASLAFFTSWVQPFPSSEAGRRSAHLPISAVPSRRRLFQIRSHVSGHIFLMGQSQIRVQITLLLNIAGQHLSLVCTRRESVATTAREQSAELLLAKRSRACRWVESRGSVFRKRSPAHPHICACLPYALSLSFRTTGALYKSMRPFAPGPPTIHEIVPWRKERPQTDQRKP